MESYHFILHLREELCLVPGQLTTGPGCPGKYVEPMPEPYADISLLNRDRPDPV